MRRQVLADGRTARVNRGWGVGRAVTEAEEGEAIAKLATALRCRSAGGGGGRRVTPMMVLAEDGGTVEVEKVLSNVDLYCGFFAGNEPHGRGKYLWSDGCMDEGDWRRGKASGKGKCSWPSGATFEGEFKIGRMEGFGTFIGADGDTYRGSWIADQKNGFGCKSLLWLLRRNPCCFTTSEVKKPGQTISKGHKNCDLMLNLQLGIRYSVGKSASLQMRELRPSDFDPRDKYWTRFLPEGSKITPPHQTQSSGGRITAPWSSDPVDYMMAICGHDALRELSSPPQERAEASSI